MWLGFFYNIVDEFKSKVFQKEGEIETEPIITCLKVPFLPTVLC